MDLASPRRMCRECVGVLERCHRTDFHCLFSVCCTTIVTAIFYVNMDIIMISQFVYYKLKNQKMTKFFNQGSRSLKNFCVTWIIVYIALCVILLCQLSLRNQDQTTVIQRSNNSLDMIEMSGFVCGYISCVFYLGSRFPQLYKNFRRRSTEGTSYLLFALAMMGNCTYGLSLVLKMPATKSFWALYFLHHLPWLIGSFGVLFLDIFIQRVLSFPLRTAAFRVSARTETAGCLRSARLLLVLIESKDRG
ncbi:lysosomal amino acid transporter 1 homolog isoform X3 [Tyto alba]|uniref:lysosomal amino acid transporter 1 homolog isoform X3 n=1 Tax=Tyto alba TaxID=56313 RepID=UPI001402BF05|nr:lysosomal amino acid transporter 1 homolog isoform X3 [Tyto alba]